MPSLCAPGLSSLIGEIASGVVLLLFNLVLLRLSGNTGVAAYGVVANLALVGIAVFTGLCTGIQPLVSRSSGLGETGNSCGGCSVGASAPRSGLQPCCACRFSSARSR